MTTPADLTHYRRILDVAHEKRARLHEAENALAAAVQKEAAAAREVATCRRNLEEWRAAARKAHDEAAAFVVPAVPGAATSPQEAAEGGLRLTLAQPVAEEPTAAEAAGRPDPLPVDVVEPVSRYGAARPAAWTSDFTPAPEHDPRD